MPNPIFQGISNYDSIGVGLLADSAQNLYVDVNYWAGTSLAVPTNWGTAASGHVIGTNSELFVGNNAVSGSNPVPISATTAANTKTNPIFSQLADGTNDAILGAFGTAPATSIFALAVEAALVANVSGTPTALTATGSSLNVNITGGSSAGTQYTDETAESAGAFTGTVAMLYNGTDVVGLRGDSNNDLYVRMNDGTHAITAAISAWGTAPTGTFVEGVNANLFIGGVIASSAASGIQLVGISGHSGVTLDAVLGATKPANVLQVGGNDGTNAYAVPLASGGGSVVVSGTVSIGAGPFTVVGNLTNNNAAPSTTNLGVLPAVAESAPVSYTVGDQVLTTVTLGGSTRVMDAVDANASSINFFATANSAAGVSISTAQPIISIQTTSASTIYRLRGIDVMALNGAAALFQLWRTPAAHSANLSGASFSAITGTNMQVDTSATNLTTTNSTLVDAGFVAEQKARDKGIMIYIAPGADGDILSLVLTSTSGSSLVAGAFQWSEQAAAL